MTSVETSIRQSTDYYIPIADIRGLETATGVLLSYHAAANRFSTCWWAAGPGATGAVGAPITGRYYSSLVANAGLALLKDMGKTVVSSNRQFRKVQLVAPAGQANSTFGVGGDAGGAANDYLTAYIELATEGSGAPAKVARFGR